MDCPRGYIRVKGFTEWLVSMTKENYGKQGCFPGAIYKATKDGLITRSLLGIEHFTPEPRAHSYFTEDKEFYIKEAKPSLKDFYEST